MSGFQISSKTSAGRFFFWHPSCSQRDRCLYAALPFILPMLTLWVMSWTGAELEEMTDQGSCEGWVVKTYSCLPDITPTQWPPLPKSLSLPRLGWASDQPCYVVLTVKTNFQWAHCLFLAIWYDFLALQWKNSADSHRYRYMLNATSFQPRVAKVSNSGKIRHSHVHSHDSQPDPTWQAWKVSLLRILAWVWKDLSTSEPWLTSLRAT